MQNVSIEIFWLIYLSFPVVLCLKCFLYICYKSVAKVLLHFSCPNLSVLYIVVFFSINDAIPGGTWSTLCTSSTKIDTTMKINLQTKKHNYIKLRKNKANSKGKRKTEWVEKPNLL